MSNLLIAIFVISCLLIPSCRSGPSTMEENEEKIIKLSTPSKELYDTCVIVKLLKLDDYEIHIPLISISKFVEFRDEDILFKYVNYLNEVLISSQKGILDGPFLVGNHYNDMRDYRRFVSKDKQFFIKDSKLFDSGEYFIYNTKTHEYANEVNIHIRSYYSGPLSAFYSFEVFVNNILIYSKSMTS